MEGIIVKQEMRLLKKFETILNLTGYIEHIDSLYESLCKAKIDGRYDPLKKAPAKPPTKGKDAKEAFGIDIEHAKNMEKRRRFWKKVNRLEKQLEKFTKYLINSPIRTVEENGEQYKITIGIDKEVMNAKTNGEKTTWVGKWWNEVDIPEPPKRIEDVF